MAEINEDAILQKIDESGGIGSYGEGRIGTGIQEMQKLAGMVQSGDIDYEQYANISQKVVPKINQIIGSLYSGGSASASAAQNVGAQDFLDNFYTEFLANRDAKQMMGRYLEPEELAMAQSAYSGPNGETTGRAFVANVSERYKASPEYLKGQSGEYGGQVSQMFQSLIGRDATPDEIEHFGSMLASGNTDAFELSNFMKQTPEYIERQDQLFREGVATEMEPQERKLLERGREDTLRRYAKAGTQHSPALDFAITKMMGDLADKRSSYLTGLKVDQYGGQKDAARQDYMTSLNKYLSDLDYEKNLRNQNLNALTQRGWNAQDYMTQSRDYQNWLNSQGGTQKTGLGAGVGSLVGGAAGLYFGGGNPMAGMAGSQMVSGVGSLFDNFS
ncbi:MAG TPA: hypothetical protein VMW34_06465 [Anaerolineales bacterium]|nr:hypothetical protein [Anaerolineales bacterium]